uniref:Uncharacterized protein n=1 Tax=Siphoviridae sp. ctYh54 TaxID=2826379 RepID=A0A8S5MEV9_9CAUD|nr:MAG TPA: hypothetical protein [Siphoviridae sp. ctYh54]
MSYKLSEEAALTVKELAEKAAPHRINIMDTLGKKMTFLRQSFVLHFVKDIDKKKDKEEYVETKVAQEKVFRKVKDWMHYEGQGSENPKYDVNKVEKLLTEVNTMVQYLRYIGHTENLDLVLARLGMTINVRPIENLYPVLAEEVTKDNVVKVFESANALQSEICEEANQITMHIFEELDDSIKYDGKTNKSGIKATDFNKLTTLEAIKRKSEEMAEKKLESIKDSTLNTIDSKLNVQTVAQTIAD